MGPLSASTSPKFSLNALDWRKILRLMLVQVAGAAVTLAPTLTHFRYIWHGIDFTPVVLLLVNGGIETGRRFLSGAKAP